LDPKRASNILLIMIPIFYWRGMIPSGCSHFVNELLSSQEQTEPSIFRFRYSVWEDIHRK
jgi:hypothetical protein